MYFQQGRAIRGLDAGMAFGEGQMGQKSRAWLLEVRRTSKTRNRKIIYICMMCKKSHKRIVRKGQPQYSTYRGGAKTKQKRWQKKTCFVLGLAKPRAGRRIMSKM